jgi:hypothetical protein
MTSGNVVAGAAVPSQWSDVFAGVIPAAARTTAEIVSPTRWPTMITRISSDT